MKIMERINKKHPQVFPYEYEYGKAIMERGKQELTCIRRLNQDEKAILDDVIRLINLDFKK